MLRNAEVVVLFSILLGFAMAQPPGATPSREQSQPPPAHAPALAAPPPTSTAARPAGSARIEREEIVAFNVETLKFHCRTCRWALRCTRSCVEKSHSEARESGVPCKVCGGTCR